MDLVFLIDTSVNSTKDYNEMRNFLFEIVNNLDITSGAVRVAMVTFSTGAYVHFRLNKYSSVSDVKNGIHNAFFYPGDRNVADAFDALRRKVFFEVYGDRPEVPDIVLFLTTGNANRNIHRTLQEADALHYFDINILAIGIGEFDHSEMDTIANKPSAKYSLRLSQAKELPGVRNKVLNQICRRELRSFFNIYVFNTFDKELIYIYKN